MNIFKELESDLGISPPSHGDLSAWARQGVLLLNAVLTVRHGQADSHKGKGCEAFTDQVIRLVNGRQEPVAFVLWGRNAQAKKSLVTNPRHLVLCAPHPSPLSAHYGFFGSRPFSKINEFLERNGRAPVDWHVPE